MRVNVGSKRPPKVDAVREVLEEYSFMRPLKVTPMEVDSEISGHPFGWNMIQSGSRNRARNSFEGCNYSIGLESGLVTLPLSNHRHYDVCIATIHDGSFFYYGFSQSIEIPKDIVQLILEDNVDLSEACKRVGLHEGHIGSEGGIIELLTNGRVTRKDQAKQALYSAMARLESNLYKK